MGGPAHRRLGEELRRHRERILRDWEGDVRQLERASQLSSPVLRDHLPHLLERIAELAEESPESVSPIGAEVTTSGERVPAPPPFKWPQVHAYSRLDAGFDLIEVGAEYAMLRRRILGTLGEELGSLQTQELQFLNQAIDRAVILAMEAHARTRHRVLSALDRMSQLGLREGVPLDELLAGFAEILLQTPSIDSVSVLLREGDELRLRAGAGLEAADQPVVRVGDGFEGEIGATGRPLETPAAAEDPRVRTVAVRVSGTKALYGVPLLAGDGIVGVAQIGSRSAAQFSDDDRLLFESMASRLTIVLRNAQLRARERGLSAASRAFAAAETLDEAGARLLDELGQAFGWDIGVHWGVSADGHLEPVTVRSAREFPEFTRATRALRLAQGEGLPGQAWATGRLQWRDEVTADPNFPRAAAAAAEGLRSAVVFPLTSGDETFGVLEFFSRRLRSSHEEGVELTTVVSAELPAFMRGLRIREELRESETEKAAYLETALDCIVGMDASGRVTLWNAAAERIFGYARSEALGAEMAELIIPPRLRDAHRHGLARYLATGEQILFDRRVEMPAVRKDGAERTVELIISRLPTQGPPRFAGFLRDITERKRSTERAEFLADAAKLLSSTLDPGAVAQSLVELVVPRLADWCALDVFEGEELRRVALAHRDPRRVAVIEELRRRRPYRPDDLVPTVVRTGRTQFVPEVNVEVLRAVSEDPAILAMFDELGVSSLVIVPLTARGRTFGALSLVTSNESGRRFDALDVRLAEELGARAALAIDNAQLFENEQAAVRVRENVLAIVSHDLRNPLSAITMGATLLMRRSTDDRATNQLEIIQRAAGRMRHLISDLLDMASIQAGRMAVETRPDDAAAIALDAFELHVAAAHEAGLNLVHELPEQGPLISADRERLLQVFSNLVGNAIKFCAPGDEIRLGLEVLPERVRFSVADTGPGIATEDLPRLFQPYWSAQRHKKQGSGLGLYISKGIIEAHRGELTVKSEPGEGTTFSFTIPRVPPNTPP